MENSKYFIYWIGLSALLIAGSAAAFSVYGLAKLFSGAFLSVVIMAGSLELGKLVTASFLYRYWKVIWLETIVAVCLRPTRKDDRSGEFRFST